MPPPLRLGIAGLGTVGAAVLRLLAQNGGLLAERAGRAISVVAVSARQRERDRGVDLKHLRWSRFQKRKSILEIQQVTLDEIRHGTSYGAMFSSVYSAPVKVWPRDR